MPDKYAFELAPVPGAANHVCLSRFDQDAGRIGSWRSYQIAQRCIGYSVALSEVSLVAGDLVEAGKTAQDHTVVDKSRVADHSAGMEPIPLTQRPVEIRDRVAGALVQPDRHGQEQLIRDRVLVRPVFVPPHAATAGVVPAANQILEDAPSGVQVPLLSGQVVGLDPGQCPPSVVVEETDQEMSVPPSGGTERPMAHPSISLVSGALRVIEDGGEGVGGIPPSCCPPASSPWQIPSLQRTHSGCRACAKVALGRLSHGDPQSFKLGGRASPGNFRPSN